MLEALTFLGAACCIGLALLAFVALALAGGPRTDRDRRASGAEEDHD